MRKLRPVFRPKPRSVVIETKLVDIQPASLRVEVTLPDGRVFHLPYEATIHKSSSLLVRRPDRDRITNYADDYQAGEQLAKWMATIPYLDSPHFYSFRGEYILIELTEDDAVKFKVFFC